MGIYLPAWCFECRDFISKDRVSDSPYLCITCYRKLPFINKSKCLKCGRNHEAMICQEDWAKQISKFHAVFSYEDPVRHWISRLKYSRNLNAGKILQNFVKRWFEENRLDFEEIDVLLTVPVHLFRLKQRGFNQSNYLLNTQRGLKLRSSALRRVRHTSHQAGMSRKERSKNLKGAFRVGMSLKNKKVLLFDDVCTTGQTLSEISSSLVKAGAQQVDVFVLCRTMPS